MISLRQTFFLWLALVLFAPLCSARPLELKSWLGSSFLVPGEEGVLWVMVTSAVRPDDLPTVPEVENVGIKLTDEHLVATDDEENKIYIYEYSLVSFDVGTHIIPEFSLAVAGQTLKSQPQQIHVAELPASAWKTHQVRQTTIRYAATVFTAQSAPFVGEVREAEVKVYLPAKYPVPRARIANVEHEGVVAYRFEPSISPVIWSGRSYLCSTKARLNGTTHHSVCFRSTFTPLTSGAISLGPGKATFEVSIQTPSGGVLVRKPIESSFPVDSLQLTAKPLPPNPPTGFDGAVGQFRLFSAAESTQLKLGAPVAVQVSVSGTGNLDTLPAPELQAPEKEWKIYKPSRLARQGARRDTTGIATFSQILRPEGRPKEIPPFRLVTFNPASESYEVLTTPPISLKILSTSAAKGTAAADMNNILGLVDPTRKGHPLAGSGWWKLWQLIPIALALYLIWRLVQRFLIPRIRQPEHERILQQAIEHLTQCQADSREFLRASGSFIERWIPENERDESITELLDLRDLESYRPDRAPEPISTDQRANIISLLGQRARTALSLLAVFLIVSLHADANREYYHQAQEAWDSGDFASALQHFESSHSDGEHPPDVLYNAGNCYFQLGEIGIASLFYQRALLASPEHTEAERNLAFLQVTTGVIETSRSEHERLLSHLHLDWYRAMLQLGIWATLLSLAGFFAALPAKLKSVLWSSIVAGPILIVSGTICLRYYPDDIESAPPGELAVISSRESTPAVTEAAVDARLIMQIPPGALCRVLAERGSWSYVEFANRSEGWVPSNALSRLTGTEFPSPGA